MKILLMSIGTRGDMEPFIAIGELLLKKGHQVVCAFPEQFRELVSNADMRFISLGPEFIDLLESDAGKTALGGEGSRFKKILAYVKLARNSTEVNKLLIHKQNEIVAGESPGRILYNGKAVYPMLYELDHRGKSIFISPVPYMHFVKDHAHVAFNRNFGEFFNKLTYKLADFGLVTTMLISLKWLGVPKSKSRKQIRKGLQSNRAIYTISPSLFSKPDYWGDHLRVLGFHQSNPESDWKPDPSLIEFLENHERVLFITFGSMTNMDPVGKTRIILDILERNRIPAIINTAAGGLVRTENYDRNLVHFLPKVPYDWIFPRIYGVVHHGGSGTTHMSLKYGCPSLIIPHIIDQFAWDKINQRIGAGPAGIRIGRLSSRHLEPKILDLMSNASYKHNAERLSRQMRAEDFREPIYRAIVE